MVKYQYYQYSIYTQIQITKRSTKIFSTGGSKVNSLTTKVGFTNGTSGENMAVTNATEPISMVLTRNADNKLKNESDITPVYNITYPWGSKMFIHEEGRLFKINISAIISF